MIFTIRGVGQQDAEWNPVKTINTALLNFGGSSLCAYVAVDHVPENHDYYYGRMQVSQAAGVVPFGRRIFKLSNTKDSSSSLLFTTLIQGRSGRRVAGTGTGMFADFYCDFGYAGTAVIFFLTGFGTSFVQFKARSTYSIFWNIAYIVLCAHLALVSRYTLVNGLVRYVLYSVFYAAAIAIVLGIPLRARFQQQVPNPEPQPRHPQLPPPNLSPTQTQNFGESS